MGNQQETKMYKKKTKVGSSETIRGAPIISLLSKIFYF